MRGLLHLTSLDKFADDPANTMPTYSQHQPNLEDEHAVTIEEKCKRWEARNPDQSVALRSVVLAHLGWPSMPPDEPLNFRRQVFEAAVRERIRMDHGWPSVRQWVATRG